MSSSTQTQNSNHHLPTVSASPSDRTDIWTRKRILEHGPVFVVLEATIKQHHLRSVMDDWEGWFDTRKIVVQKQF